VSPSWYCCYTEYAAIGSGWRSAEVNGRDPAESFVRDRVERLVQQEMQVLSTQFEAEPFYELAAEPR
jgi:hypothetical protein